MVCVGPAGERGRVIRFATAAVGLRRGRLRGGGLLLPHLRAGPGARPGRHGGQAAGPGLKDPDGTVMAFGLRSWNDFAADAKAGRCDPI